ncbi:MAG: HAMP domain-containing protein [Patescibacteria group bacterium]
MKLRTKLILFFTVLIVFLVGGLIYYTNNYLKNYLRNKIINDFRIIAEISEGAFFTFNNNIKIRTTDWSSDGYIRNTTEKILIGKASGDNKQMTGLIKEFGDYLENKKLPYAKDVIIVDILDKNGIVIVSSRADRIGVDESKEEKEYGAVRFYEAIQSNFGEVFVKNIVFETDESMEPMIHGTARIFSTKTDDNGKLIPLDAVILVHFSNTKQLNDVLLGKWSEEIFAGKTFLDQYLTGEIYLVNGDGLMITPSRFIKDSVLKQKINTFPVKACFEEDKKINETYINYLGNETLGISQCLKLEGVVLLVEASLKEVLAPIKIITNHFLAGAFLALIIGFMGIIFLSSWFLKNLISVINAIKKISKESDLNARININSKDEIGYLAEIFNNMLDNIQDIQEKIREAEIKLKETNLSLERRIHERTEDLIKLKNNLEIIVFERTRELQEKLTELEKFKELTVGRELKMIELKKKLKELQRE